MAVSDAVGRTLAARGVTTVFGVIGSGNYRVTAALQDGGARFVAARHESGSTSMADALFRTSGHLGVVSVHQGPGLTNTITAIGEAVKSHIPLIVVAGAAAQTSWRSNFKIDQEALAESVGAGFETLTDPSTAVSATVRAHQRAIEERRPIIINMPIDVQDVEIPFDPAVIPTPTLPAPTVPPSAMLADVLEELKSARHLVIVSGYGGWLSGAKSSLVELAERLDASLMTSGMALGMFEDHPRNKGICGGFSDSAGVANLESADMLLAVGSSLTNWTTRGGTVFRAPQKVIRIDTSGNSTSAGVSGETLLVGDAKHTVDALLGLLGSFHREPKQAEPAPEPRKNQSHQSTGSPKSSYIDAEAAASQLSEMLPPERTLVIDGGHFIGWPVKGIRVPDPAGFVFSSAGFQSIGLGMGSAVGAAISRPDRLTVLASGDGGFMMGLAELETMVRLELPIVVVIFNDRAYGAEVHHFGMEDPHVGQVQFPAFDIAQAARGYGAEAAQVETLDQLSLEVKSWLEGPQNGPVVLDLRIDPAVTGEWAEQDFLRH